MTLTDIAFLNLKRRKAKAAFVLAGLTIGVATVVALVTLFQSVSHGILHKLEKYGANLLVVPKTESLSLTYAGLDLGGVSFRMEEIREADLAKIRSIPGAKNLAAVGPVVLGTVQVGGRPALLAGLDLDAARVLKPWWRVRGTMPGEAEVLLGSSASRVLGVGEGGRLRVGEATYPVVGVLEETGSQDDQLIVAPVRTAQAILRKPGVISMVEVAAHCADCPVDTLMAEIAQVLPTARVTAIRQVVEGRLAAMEQFERFLYGVSGVVVLVGCLVVLVTMMGSVRERTAEIGVFRAIGFRRSAIMSVVLGEATVLSALAGTLGYGLGVGATAVLLPFFSEAGGPSVHLDPLLAASALGLALLLGISSSLYPAVQAARLDPNEALRAL
ncbi:MAG: ABC transporter permease [Deltaproteobacteria bacterium]|nr:ABC transporter permease [Deltaproteobacteria bacterium]